MDQVGIEPTHPKEQIYSLPQLSNFAADPWTSYTRFELVFPDWESGFLTN